jgi:hypothetical protein
MKPIQFFLLALVLFAVTRLVQKYRQRAIQLLELCIWLLVWAGAAFIIVFPDSTNFLAALLGIWRGADLVLYTSLLVIFYLIFRIHLALDRVQQEITAIVRMMALNQLGAGGSRAAETGGSKESRA